MMKKYLICLIFLIGGLTASAQQLHARLTVQLNSLQNPDSLVVLLDKYGDLNITRTERYVYLKAAVINHIARFEVPLSVSPECFRISLTDRENENHFNRGFHLFIDLFQLNYYLENGDDIVMSETNGNMTYTGKGSEKFKLGAKLTEIADSFLMGDNYTYANIRDYLLHQDTSLRQKLNAIRSAGARISPAMKSILEIDAVGNYCYRFHQLMFPLQTIPGLADSVKSLRNTASLPVDTSLMNKSLFIQYPASYAQGLIDLYSLDSVIFAKRPLNVGQGYRYFITHYKGELRERLITHYLFWNKNTKGYSTQLAKNALDICRNRDFKSLLTDLAAAGNSAGAIYSFSLRDTLGRNISLSQFKGKVLIVDFWFTGCGPCRETGPVLKELEEKYAGKPVVFISISTDTKLLMWKKSVREGVYTSNKATNLYTGGGGFNHPLAKFFNVSGGPTLLFFDQQGKYQRLADAVRFDHGKEIEERVTAALKR